MDFLTVTGLRNAGFEAFDQYCKAARQLGIPLLPHLWPNAWACRLCAQKSPKGYGRNARIERRDARGSARVLVEGSDQPMGG